jgi:hypothetical protein
MIWTGAQPSRLPATASDDACAPVAIGQDLHDLQKGFSVNHIHLVNPV